MKIRLLRLLGAVVLLVAAAPAPDAGANTALERLTCDVPAIVFGHDATTVWALDLETGDTLWSIPFDGLNFVFDIGQDPLGRLFVVQSGVLYRIDGSPGTDFDPRSPGESSLAVTQVATVVLPAGVSASINASMLSFDKYGMGYFIADRSGDGDLLIRFDPDAAPNGDGEIVAEVVVDDLQAKGAPEESASGDMFITNSTAYVAWTTSELVFIGLTDDGTKYVYDPTVGVGSAGVIGVPDDEDEGELLDVEGFGMAATGGRTFIADRDSIIEFTLTVEGIATGAIIDAPTSDVWGLTGNGEAIFDECGGYSASSAASTGAAAPSGPTLECPSQPIAPGQPVTVPFSGSAAEVEYLWRASTDASVVAVSDVRADVRGNGSVAFLVPAAAAGRQVTVELVEWTSCTFTVSATAVPTRIPAGDGPLNPSTAGLFLLAGATGLVLRRLQPVREG